MSKTSSPKKQPRRSNPAPATVPPASGERRAEAAPFVSKASMLALNLIAEVGSELDWLGYNIEDMAGGEVGADAYALNSARSEYLRVRGKLAELRHEVQMMLGRAEITEYLRSGEAR